MRYVSATHADLVAEYERIQAETGGSVWPGRQDAPWRIRSFVMAGPTGESSD